MAFYAISCAIQLVLVMPLSAYVLNTDVLDRAGGQIEARVPESRTSLDEIRLGREVLDEQQELAREARNPSISTAISRHVQDPMMVQKDIESLSDAEEKLRLATQQLNTAMRNQQQALNQQAALRNRLALNQRLEAKRLNKIEARAENTLEGLAHPTQVGFAPALEVVDDALCRPACKVGNGVCARRSSSQGDEFSCVCRQPFDGPSCTKRTSEPVTLYQTETKSGRARNPALAFLLEPLLYFYSMLNSTLFVILAGVFSAVCMYTLKVPGVVWEMITRPLGRLTSCFKYPSTLLATRGTDTTSARHLSGAAESEDDAEAAVPSHRTRRKQEVWRPAARNNPPGTQAEEWEGYVDDESDGEGEKFSRPPVARYQPPGYVDER